VNCPHCKTLLHHVAKEGSHVLCPVCEATLVVTAKGFSLLVGRLKRNGS